MCGADPHSSVRCIRGHLHSAKTDAPIHHRVAGNHRTTGIRSTFERREPREQTSDNWGGLFDGAVSSLPQCLLRTGTSSITIIWSDAINEISDQIALDALVLRAKPGPSAATRSGRRSTALRKFICDIPWSMARELCSSSGGGARMAEQSCR